VHYVLGGLMTTVQSLSVSVISSSMRLIEHEWRGPPNLRPHLGHIPTHEHDSLKHCFSFSSTLRVSVVSYTFNMSLNPPLMVPDNLAIDTMDTSKLAAALETPSACVAITSRSRQI
jgi:hypothetical protein